MPVKLALLLTLLLGFSSCTKELLTWDDYTPVRLQTALESGKPVLLDFYAEWCIPCMRLKHNTFRDKRVAAALADFRLVRVDMTQGDNILGQGAANQYGVRGYPAVIFFDSQGREISEFRIGGYVPPEAFLKFLEENRGRIFSEASPAPAP